MKDYPNDGIAYDAVPYKLPLIPLRGIYMFPHMVIHFDIGRQKSLESLEEAMLRDSEVILCTQKDYKVEKTHKKRSVAHGGFGIHQTNAETAQWQHPCAGRGNPAGFGGKNRHAQALLCRRRQGV